MMKVGSKGAKVIAEAKQKGDPQMPASAGKGEKRKARKSGGSVLSAAAAGTPRPGFKGK